MKREERNPLEILSAYQKKVARMKEVNAPYKEIQPLQISDVLFIQAKLHPTKKQATKDMTRELIKFLCDEGICTAQQIYDRFGWSDKPVMARLKLFREFGLVRRESKKYYMPTPRLLELRDKYLERVCG